MGNIEQSSQHNDQTQPEGIIRFAFIDHGDDRASITVPFIREQALSFFTPNNFNVWYTEAADFPKTIADNVSTYVNRYGGVKGFLGASKGREPTIGEVAAYRAAISSDNHRDLLLRELFLIDEFRRQFPLKTFFEGLPEKELKLSLRFHNESNMLSKLVGMTLSRGNVSKALKLQRKALESGTRSDLLRENHILQDIDEIISSSEDGTPALRIMVTLGEFHQPIVDEARKKFLLSGIRVEETSMGIAKSQSAMLELSRKMAQGYKASDQEIGYTIFAKALLGYVPSIGASMGLSYKEVDQISSQLLEKTSAESAYSLLSGSHREIEQYIQSFFNKP